VELPEQRMADWTCVPPSGIRFGYLVAEHTESPH